jgi:hypothetical protein
LEGLGNPEHYSAFTVAEFEEMLQKEVDELRYAIASGKKWLGGRTFSRD